MNKHCGPYDSYIRLHLIGEVITIRKLDLYWMSNREWWQLNNHVPVIKECAPIEAKESYIRYKEQEHTCNYIFFLNPRKDFGTKCKRIIQEHGYEVKKSEDTNKHWIYKRENSIIEMEWCEDYVGPYIIVVCDGLSGEILRKKFFQCPECGSYKLQVSILFCWRNEVTEQLYKEKLLDYGPGAYDRLGTRAKTHECLDCGCQWHNEASIYYWNQVIQQGMKLSPEILWGKDSKQCSFIRKEIMV